MTHDINERDLKVRVIFPRESTISAYTDDAKIGAQIRNDVQLVAMQWLNFFDIKPKTNRNAIYEFVSDYTLNYIESLEELLEEIRNDPDTSEDLYDRIEAVLR